jgi:hypothetical protein
MPSRPTARPPLIYSEHVRQMFIILDQNVPSQVTSRKQFQIKLYEQKTRTFKHTLFSFFPLRFRYLSKLSEANNFFRTKMVLVVLEVVLV